MEAYLAILEVETRLRPVSSSRYKYVIRNALTMPELGETMAH